MEINLKRQAEYNNYNVSILELLYQEGAISASQLAECREALGKLQNTLMSVKAINKKHFKVIPVSI